MCWSSVRSGMMGFYKDLLSSDWIMIVSVFPLRCQGICASNRGNIPPAISDTGVLSATQGMYDMMSWMILERCTDGKMAARGRCICICQSKENV